MDDQTSLQCPVCKARFRRVVHCPRCGADLSILMSLASRAYQARRAARRALCQGDLRRARQSARHAQSLHATPAGRRLQQLTTILEPL